MPIQTVPRCAFHIQCLHFHWLAVFELLKGLIGMLVWAHDAFIGFCVVMMIIVLGEHGMWRFIMGFRPCLDTQLN